ncbi:MAG: 4-(cytidine 5'-diphospho)-2-C-methyl-D-erythritol kinase [Rikenellaceae bacterium]|jgi:4-diphosphocytidyl-2-C-methyl-D-erythritol kinase|nr:4-(cytidine 5'-diphospho)-2-C-methyl-D-erythritol kinase [Rikenellaceae bacterium]
MLLFPGCKINLGLDVLARRADGYHDLSTCMIPVSGLCDAVEMLPAAEDTLTVYGEAIDCPPEKNLCMKALKLMQARHGAGNAHIYLQKHIPSGAGLGGGSADAAAVILAANEVFGLNLTQTQMEAAAGELGSDIPFFIASRAAMATSRGEVLTPADPAITAQLSGKYLLIVKPPVGVSTAEAYAGVRPAVPAVPLAEHLKAPLAEWKATVANAFEPHIFAAHPQLAAIKERLYAAGALYASMSGSGSALYGIFEREPEAAEFPAEYFVYKQVIP